MNKYDKERDRLGKSIAKAVIIVILIMLIFLSIGSMFTSFTNHLYEGYPEFCEGRGMVFESNYGSPICYKITNGDLKAVSIGKLNGEIYTT